MKANDPGFRTTPEMAALLTDALILVEEMTMNGPSPELEHKMKLVGKASIAYQMSENLRHPKRGVDY